MTKLKQHREKLNFTQKELAEKTNISIRTIQRIEAGQEPKGHTLKVLAEALQLEEQDLLEVPTKSNLQKTKWVNTSSLAGTLLPPLNIFFPLLFMFRTKTFNKLTKQILSLQIVWTLLMVLLVVSSALIRNAYLLSDAIPPLTLGVLILMNIFIILRNAAEISKKQKLYIKLNFSIL